MKRLARFLLTSALALVIALSPSASLAAIDEQTLDNYAQNNILFYNPNEASCSAGDANIIGADNAEKIWNYFTQKSLTPIATAGIMGNFQAESGFRPTVKQGFITTALTKDDGTVGFGLAQWTPASRKSGLFAKMDEAGLSKYYGAGYGSASDDIPENDLNSLLKIELDYAWSGESGWSIENIIDDLNAAQSISGDTGSTKIFHEKYERSADDASRIQGRMDLAEAIYQRFGGTDNSNGCSGFLTPGGMDLAAANEFMKLYKEGELPAYYTGVRSGSFGDAAHYKIYNAGCSGGALANCVAFSQYFVNRYTSKEYINTSHGMYVVSDLIRLGFADGGNTPKAYAVFSESNSNGVGHTGVILGVDTSRNKVIVGEAGCGNTLEWTRAREYDLARFTSGTYTYAYSDGLLQGSL
jgi:hypothetical protein